MAVSFIFPLSLRFRHAGGPGQDVLDFVDNNDLTVIIDVIGSSASLKDLYTLAGHPDTQGTRVFNGPHAILDFRDTISSKTYITLGGKQILVMDVERKQGNSLSELTEYFFTDTRAIYRVDFDRSDTSPEYKSLRQQIEAIISSMKFIPDLKSDVC